MSQICYKHLTEEYFAPFALMGFPPNMTEIGAFTALRTYCRWNEEKGRRETWAEVCRRAVEYNCSLAETSTEEARQLFENQFYLKQSLSGRTNWVGGTEAAYLWPLSNFNCAFIVIDQIESFRELMYLLMLGAGVGTRLLRKDVRKLGKVKHSITKVEFNCHYDPSVYPKIRNNESRQFTRINDTGTVFIGDSKEGWCDALLVYLRAVMGDKNYRHLIDQQKLDFVFSFIRPHGERLKRFGGTASGPEPLMSMFQRIHEIVKGRAGKRLRPIDCLDMIDIIGEIVVAGGVRRTAINGIGEAKDMEFFLAKSPVPVGKEHRYKSNNSVMFYHEPSLQELKFLITTLRKSGEPGFVNALAALARRGDFEGLNPCFEILLRSRAVCNLATVNCMAFVKNGLLNSRALMDAHALASKASYRMTCVTLELPQWNKIQKADRLCGVSLTGWYDMVEATGLSIDTQRELLIALKENAKKVVYAYADELCLSYPKLITTVKPEGTLSLVFGAVSPGVHRPHASYYLRRIEVEKNNPIVFTAQELGWSVVPKPGDVSTVLVEFPIQSPSVKTKYDVSAIEQLESYKMFQDNYTDHNTSITVTVREHEWDDVVTWLHENWKSCIAISFLSLDDHIYPMAPYEAITKEEYEKRKSTMRPFDLNVLQKYDQGDLGENNEKCENGSCPIR